MERINILSADIADKGRDNLCIMIGYKYIVNNVFYYELRYVYTEAKSETVDVVGRIKNLCKEYSIKEINVDCIGMGVGVLSLLNEWSKISELKVKVIGCHFGRKAKDFSRFLNKKAEMYFYLKNLLEEGRISLMDDSNLLKEMLQMEWEYTSSGKVKIIDPGKKDDRIDALVYLCWNHYKRRKYNIA